MSLELRKRHKEELRAQIAANQERHKREHAEYLLEGEKTRSKLEEEKGLIEVGCICHWHLEGMTEEPQCMAGLDSIHNVRSQQCLQLKRFMLFCPCQNQQRLTLPLDWICNVFCLQAIRQRKLHEMEVQGVPAKYRAELARKKLSNW